MRSHCLRPFCPLTFTLISGRHYFPLLTTHSCLCEWAAPASVISMCPWFLHRRLGLIVELFSDQKCQNVNVGSQISWAKLPFSWGTAHRFAVGKCNVPKVRQMVNGKAISNKPSVFFFSRPLASLRTFLPTSLYSDTGRKRILRSLVLNPQLSALWSRCGSR